MSSQVTLPRLGQGMESGTIVRWLKAEGDTVEKGEPLYELDTEKVTQEVEAEASGVLLKILAGEGEEIEVGKPIAVIGEAGRGGRRGRARSARPRSRRPRRSRARREADGGRERRARGAGPRPQDAPERARGAARERRPRQGLAARAADRARAGHRPRGARAAPAPRAASSPRTSSAPRRRPRRRAAARGRSRAAARRGRGRPAHRHAQDDRAPHDRGVAGARLPDRDDGRHDARRSGSARASSSAWARATRSPTYSDILTKVCAVALMRHRAVNALFAGDEVHLIPTANVGIAVAIPQRARRPGAAELRDEDDPAARERARRPRRAHARRQASAGRSRGRHVHDLEPRHVRRRALRRRPQPAAGRDPRGRRDRGARRRRATASSPRGPCSS